MKSATRFCLITSNYPPDIGGPAKFASTFPSSLSMGPGILVTTTSGKSDSIEFSNYTVIRISRALNTIIRFLRIVSEVRRNTSRQCTTIIANGFFIETFFSSILSRREYVAKIPGDIVWEKAKNAGITNSNILEFQSCSLPIRLKILRQLNSISIRRARIVICPTEELARIVEMWGVPQSKIRQIPNSVDTQLFIPETRTVKDIDVVCVNRLVEWKGMKEVIHSCATLNLSLVIAGSGPQEEELKEFGCNLGAKVEFLGDISNSELPSLMNRARYYVLNSTYEATAYSLLEAMACGVIPIARLNTGSAEVIQQNISGLLIGGREYPDLLSALNHLASISSKHAEFSSAARNRVLEKFDLQVNFKKIAEVLLNG